MYIFPSSPFAGVKMPPSLIPRKITDFARLGEKITGKIYDFAILWVLGFCSLRGRTEYILALYVIKVNLWTQEID